MLTLDCQRGTSWSATSVSGTLAASRLFVCISHVDRKRLGLSQAAIRRQIRSAETTQALARRISTVMGAVLQRVCGSKQCYKVHYRHIPQLIVPSREVASNAWSRPDLTNVAVYFIFVSVNKTCFFTDRLSVDCISQSTATYPRGRISSRPTSQIPSVLKPRRIYRSRRSKRA